MKTGLLTATFLILFTANAFAESTDIPTSQTERKSLITAKRVIIGTAMTIAATLAGYYWFAKPELRVLAPKKARTLLGGATAALPQQPAPVQPPQDFERSSANHLELSLAAETQPLADQDTAIEEEKAVQEEFDPDKKSRVVAQEQVAEKKKRVRLCRFLATDNAGVLMKIDDPVLKYTRTSTIIIADQPYEPVNSNSDLTNLSINHAFIENNEIIAINSETERMLDIIYLELLLHFREQHPNGATPEQFFAFLIRFMRAQVFYVDRAGSKSDAVIELIQIISANEDIIKLKTSESGRVIPIINLVHHLRAGLGVCRHHGVVLTYLAQRFMKEQNSCLRGGSMHITAGDAGEDGHVWGVYIDPTGHAGLHVDSLWDLNLPLSLDDEEQSLYNSQIERFMDANREQFLVESVDFSEINIVPNEEPSWGTQGGIFSFSLSDEGELKEAENTPERMKRSIDLDDSKGS